MISAFMTLQFLYVKPFRPDAQKRYTRDSMFKPALLLSVLLPGLALAQTAGQEFTMTLLHTNDVHSRIEPAIVNRKEYGGFARLATLVKKHRRTDINPVLLHAGDAFQGTLYYNVYKGLADGALMNLVGYDAMTLGNHEFDDGPAGLAPFLRMVNFPVVNTNMDFTDEPLVGAFVKPEVILNVGKERVGIIGAMTTDIFSIASPGDNIKLKPLVTSLQAQVDSLTKRKINKVILLSHLGYSEDIALAKELKNVDVIIGGHSHSFLGSTEIPGFPTPMGSYPTKSGDALIITAWEWAKLLGRLQVTFDKTGKITKYSGQPIPVDERISDDRQVAAMITAFRKPIEQLKAQVVGDTVGGIDRDFSKGPELAMGNVIADAQLAFTEKQKTVIALMNQGGVRAEIAAGPINYDELISVQPFGNTLVVLDLTGTEILAALEVGAGKGSFIQVSKGFSYTVKKVADRSYKVQSARFNGMPLGLDTTYRVVVNSFMARGGDGFVSLQNAKGFRLDTGFSDLDAMIEYFKKNKPTEGIREGRIIEGK
jgi:5'-nucleotidase